MQAPPPPPHLSHHPGYNSLCQWFSSSDGVVPGDAGQCLEIFLVVTGGVEVGQAPSGWRPGMLPTHPYNAQDSFLPVFPIKNYLDLNNHAHEPK